MSDSDMPRVPDFIKLKTIPVSYEMNVETDVLNRSFKGRRLQRVSVIVDLNYNGKVFYTLRVNYLLV